MSVRSRKDLQRNIIRRSLQDGKFGRVKLIAEMIQRVASQTCEGRVDMFNFLSNYGQQPQAIRALNLIEEYNERPVRWRAGDAPPVPEAHNTRH